jgi:hypothetical protein
MGDLQGMGSPGDEDNQDSGKKGDTESQTGSEAADDGERGGSGKTLPVKSTPGALEYVDWGGGGSQSAKDAKLKAANRRRRKDGSSHDGQVKSNLGRTFQRPSKEEEGKFHVPLRSSHLPRRLHAFKA